MLTTWWQKALYAATLAILWALHDFEEARREAEDEVPSDKTLDRTARFRAALRRKLGMRSPKGDPGSEGGSPASG